MKKIILLLALSALLFACKSTSAVSTNMDSKAQIAMKGNWVVSSVTYPGSQYIKVNSFGIADSDCFVGSQWKLVSNNNTGTMTLAKPGCTSFSSPITWYVNKDKEFVLKVLDEGMKARKVNQGFVLKLQNQTATSFQLIDKINVGGNMTDVVYQFQKN